MTKTKSFAERMKMLRERKKVSLEELAQKTSYPVKYLEQIEKQEVIAPVSVILSVSQALEIASEDFLMSREDKLKRKKAMKARNDAFIKRTENYSYQVLTPEGKHKHLNAFRVRIEPFQDHQMAAYHHPGEEFIYVLSGKLELKVGQRIHNLGQDESIHFDSAKAHKLRSISDEPTIILVTIYSV